MANYLELLTCSVCLDIYNEPVTLSCLHSFCKQCIKSYAKNQKTINCSVCQRPTEDKSIQKDFRIAEFVGLLETFKSKSEIPLNCCDVCDDDIEPIEIHLCKDCGKVLCMNCRLNHGKGKSTKTHTVYALSSKPIPYCKEHKKRLEYYCNDTKCKKFLCVSCTLVFHDGHDKRTIQQQTEIVTDDIEKNLEIIKAHTETLRSYIENSWKNETKIKKKFNEIDKLALKNRDFIIKQAKEAYQEQANAINESQSQLLGIIRENEIKLVKREKNLSHFIEHTVINLEKKSFFDVNEIHCEMNNLLESEIHLQLVEIEKLELISKTYDEFNIREQIRSYMGEFNADINEETNRIVIKENSALYYENCMEPQLLAMYPTELELVRFSEPKLYPAQCSLGLKSNLVPFNITTLRPKPSPRPASIEKALPPSPTAWPTPIEQLIGPSPAAQPASIEQRCYPSPTTQPTPIRQLFGLSTVRPK